MAEDTAKPAKAGKLIYLGAGGRVERRGNDIWITFVHLEGAEPWLVEPSGYGDEFDVARAIELCGGDPHAEPVPKT